MLSVVLCFSNCESFGFFTLSQVMSPTTTTSRRLMNTTPKNPRSSSGPRMTSTTMSSLSARRSLMRAEDEPIILKKKVLSSCLSSSVSHDRTGRPVVKPFDSQVSSVQEIQRHSSESEQVRILLERQREQILADCQAEIRKHEFQADYDRRSSQKLNEMIESQKEEICRAHQGDERLRQDHQLLHEQLLKQNWDLREAHEKSLSEMRELKRFEGVNIRHNCDEKIGRRSRYYP